MLHTLEVYFKNELIFSSDGKWLHPLFELEKFLATSNCQPADLLLKDKIVGRAAALLMIRLGINQVQAVLLSEFGKDVFEKFAVNYQYDRLVAKILCRTEDLLQNEDSPEAAYRTLKKLAEQSLAAKPAL